MSEPGLEIVHRAYSAFNRQDREAISALIAPDFRWEPNPDDPEAEPRTGRDSALRFLDEQWRALPGLHTEVEEAIVRGDEIVAVVRHRARVPGSDSTVVRTEAHVWTLRGGELARLREFPNRGRALATAGAQS